jgi:hypothetical protein
MKAKSMLPLAAIGLLAVVAGCATSISQSTRSNLTAAGFKLVTPSTSEHLAKLNALPPGQVSSIQRHGKTYYVYPDAAHHQAYVGGPRQYQAYVQGRIERQMSERNTEAEVLSREGVTEGE